MGMRNVTRIIMSDSNRPYFGTPLWECGTPDPDSSISAISRGDRRAVFLTSIGDAWYFDLEKKAKQLPDVGQRGWRIDVVVRPVDFLGDRARLVDGSRGVAGTIRQETEPSRIVKNTPVRG